jgi:hypothetical protein
VMSKLTNGLTYTKSTCERYDLKFNNGWGWAIFTIDENKGMFNCQSDYGTYNYLWPNHGRKSFKHFILELAADPSYFLGKVSERNYFDNESNLKCWEQTIIEDRKKGDLTKNQAADIWEIIHNLDLTTSPELVQERLYGFPEIYVIYKEPWYTFPVDKDYPPNAVVFAKEIMPAFAEILTKEMMGNNNEFPLSPDAEKVP